MKKRTKIFLITFTIVYGVASLALHTFRNHKGLTQTIHINILRRPSRKGELLL